MFPSISRALPDTDQVTQFVATRAMTIATQSNKIVVRVNSIVKTSPTTIQPGDTVTATVRSPEFYYQHEFFQYTVDGIVQNFAVVNVSFYTVKIKPTDAGLRWYDYPLGVNQLTLRSANGDIKTLDLFYRFKQVNFNLHFVMVPATKSVYFLTATGIVSATIILPEAPINYQILKNLNLALVVSDAGNLYSIDQLGIVTQLPSLPNTTPICINYDGTRYVWAAGDGWVWKLDATNNFAVVEAWSISGKVLGIASFVNASAAIVTTSLSKIYLVTDSDAAELTNTSVGLGQPIYFNNKIYIPDSENSKLLVYNCTTAAFDSPVDTPGFSPSYTFVSANKLYVCGNDSPDVFVFDNLMHVVTTILFEEKVTWISVVSNTIVASHWLKDYVITSADQLQRVVNLKFKHGYGPVTHIGSNVVTIKTLGDTVVYGYTSPGATFWINGTKSSSISIRGVEILNGDNLNISYKSIFAGTVQVSCIIGDTAFDYQITTTAETFVPQYIDIPIGTTIDPIYSFTLEMPNNLEPVTMAIEYGTLYLNGAIYSGNQYVFANDVVTISIPIGRPQNFGLGTLPIFTIGARQFAVPISSYPNPQSSVTVDNNLAPSSLLEKKQIIGGQAALYDFILPNYYDVDILKNGISVAGNYYQIFSVGDELNVVFNSSARRYDTTVVYILGPTNYKFIAENASPFLIDYIPYNPVINPYTRSITPLIDGVAQVSGGFDTTVWDDVGPKTPTMQYTTTSSVITTSSRSAGSLTLNSSMAAISTSHAQLSIAANEDFTIECWVALSSINSAVFEYSSDDHQIAIGQSTVYFDNGFLSIAIYTDSDDVTASAATIVNFYDTPAITPYHWHHMAIVRKNSTITGYVDGIGDVANSFTYTDVFGGDTISINTVLPGTAPLTIQPSTGLLTDFRLVGGVAVYSGNFNPPAQPLESTQAANKNGNPSAEISSAYATKLLIGVHERLTYLLDSSIYNYTLSNQRWGTTFAQPAFAESSPYPANQTGAVVTVIGGDARIVINGNIMAGESIVITSTDGSTATIENAVQVHFGDTISLSRNVQSYSDGSIKLIQNILEPGGDLLEVTVGEWPIVNQLLVGAEYLTQPTHFSNVAPYRPNQSLSNIVVPKYKRKPAAQSVSTVNNVVGNPEWADYTPRNIPASTHEFLLEHNLALPASRHEFWLENSLAVPASKHEWLLETTLAVPASHHEWLLENSISLQSSQREWGQPTNLNIPASHHEFLIDNSLAVPASHHEWLLENSLAAPASHHEWLQPTTMTPESSKNEWLQPTTMVPAGSKNDWLQPTTMVPASSKNEWIQPTGFAIRSSVRELLTPLLMIVPSPTRELSNDLAFIVKSSTVQLEAVASINSNGYDPNKIDFAEKTIKIADFEKPALKYQLTKNSKFYKKISDYIFLKDSVTKNILNFKTAGYNWDKFQLASPSRDTTHKSKFILNLSNPKYFYGKLAHDMDKLEAKFPIKITNRNVNFKNLDFMKFAEKTGINLRLQEYKKPVQHYTNTYRPPFSAFKLAQENFNTLNFKTFKLAQEVFNILNFKTFKLAQEVFNKTDLRRFAGDNYTPIVSIYGRSVLNPGRLIIFAPKRTLKLNFSPILKKMGTIGLNDFKLPVAYLSDEPLKFVNIKIKIQNDNLLNYNLLDLKYKPSAIIPYGTIDLTYKQDLALGYGINKPQYQQEVGLSYGPVDATYQQDPGSTESGLVHLDYQQEPNVSYGTIKFNSDRVADGEGGITHLNLFDHMSAADHIPEPNTYQQDLSLPLVSAKGQYQQDLSLPLVSAKALYQQDLSLPLVSAKGQYQQEDGVVWHQLIDTDATAFLTAADAEAAAATDGYSFYRPYKIYDTNLYSYRVLIDTSLVCKIPKGRYAIAWLLHGG